MKHSSTLIHSLFWLVINLFFALAIQAQDKVIYLNANGQVTVEAEAFIKRNVYYEGDSTRVEVFYMSGKKTFEGHIARVSESADSLLLLGTCKWFFKNGNLKEVKRYNARHQLDGLQQVYSPKGYLKEEAQYDDGFLVNGSFSEFDGEGEKSKVFQESFEPGSKDWDLYESVSGSAKIENGVFRLISETSRGNSRYLYLPIESRAFTIEASFLHVEKNAAVVKGLLYDFEDWENYSYFTFQGRYFSIGHFDDGIHDPSMDQYGSISLELDGDNSLRIAANGRTVEFSINGSIVFKESSRAYEKSYIGFVVGGKGEAQIDDFIVKQHSGALSPIEDEDVQSTGTAFFIHPDGYLITNDHVVESGGHVFVEFTQGPFAEKGELKCEVLLNDESSDLALLHIVDNNFPRLDKLPYGLELSGAGVGASVFALGYPLVLSGMGKEIKFTDGKISSRTGYENDITTYQTSVPVQPGNSGSPLFNEKGDVVGCVNSIVSNADNVSYAIKSLYIQNLVESAGLELTEDQRIQIEDLNTEAQVKMLSQYVAIVKIR